MIQRDKSAVACQV